MKVTSLSAYTPSSNDHFFIEQEIEGYNAIPLALGSSDAKDISISFWVRSSLTGTFAGSVINSARNRSRVFEYTINTANTWEHKTVSFAGDTTGTWLTTNGKGITLRFSFGAAGTWLQNAGAWSTGNVTASSGSVNLVATNNATLYITGVQLEVGDTATPFEHRSYGDELAKCQRYFERMSFTSNQYTSIICYNEATNDARGSLQYQVTKRAAPTISATSNAFAAISTGGTGNAVSLSSDTQTLVTARIKLVNTNSTLVDGGASHVQAKADAQISIDAEL